jgi:type II secretory pathway pseudopilin PulG
MKLKNNIGKFLAKQKLSAGYTLTELLIAGAISTVVIGAAGFGVFQMTKSSQKGNAETERRTEIARAYDFISDEIRRARLVEDDSNIAADATSFTTSADKEVVLVLKIPVPDIDVDGDGDIDADDNRDRDGVDNNEANIIYYVSSPTSGSVWQGPQVLYRWGPPLNNSGNYTAGNWTDEELLDELSATTITPTCETGDVGTTDDDWTASAAPGFAACIDPNGKTAQLFINGNIVTAGSVYDETYKSADTKTVARANDIDAPGGSMTDGRTHALGGDFACLKSDGTKATVNTGLVLYDDSDTEIGNETLSTGGSTNLEIGKEQRLVITSMVADSVSGANPSTVCANKNSSDESVDIEIEIDEDGNVSVGDVDESSDDTPVPKAQVFKNGDSIPNEQAYPGQKTLKEFLEAKGVSFTEVTTGGTTEYQIDIEDNQVLVVFEIGQDQANFTNDDVNPGFDYQDNLVLITFSDAINNDY